eukprot:905058-Karenia_brevis.AAC.1
MHGRTTSWWDTGSITDRMDGNTFIAYHSTEGIFVRQFPPTCKMRAKFIHAGYVMQLQKESKISKKP